MEEQKYKVGQCLWILDYDGLHHFTRQIEIISVKIQQHNGKVMYATKVLNRYIYYNLVTTQLWKTEQEIIDYYKKSQLNETLDELFVTSKNCTLSELKYKLREEKLKRILNE